MSSTNDVDLGAVSLTVPQLPAFLRLVRLAAADCGARADLPLEDIEDLKIAVDELTYALMGETPTGEATLTVRYSVSPGLVEIEGAGPSAAEPLRLSDLSSNIVGAVVDEYDVTDADGQRRFRLVKRSQT